MPALRADLAMLAGDRLSVEGRDSLSYADMLSPGLIDPEDPVPAGVIGPNGKRAALRYNVYRNNVIVSLINALAANFPATQRITGVEFFRAMARFHIRATPPTSPLLFEYGRDFPRFIENYEYAQAMPWLADVARVERAWLDAYHATDRPPLAGPALAAIPPEALANAVFEPHPATRIVRSEFPAMSVFVMNRGDGPVGRIANVVPEDALVTRPDQEVAIRLLPPGGAEFLTQLMSGDPLGEAAAEALEASPDFDLPANIAGMIEAGVFAAVRVGDHR
jgi:Putative DNA-binding domain